MNVAYAPEHKRHISALILSPLLMTELVLTDDRNQKWGRG
jgi:hypothetical protein